MPSKNPIQRLRDIIDNILAIESFKVELDLAAFLADRKAVCAVVSGAGNHLGSLSPAAR